VSLTEGCTGALLFNNPNQANKLKRPQAICLGFFF